MNTSDYQDILSELKKIPCDKFITHYMPYPHPHELAREYFLNHPEYTHLIVMAHDVFVTVEDYNKLIKTVQETDYKIICAVCNVEREGHPSFYKMNICVKIPDLDKTKRYYNWVPYGAVSGIIQVEFQGNAFTIISREIIEKRDINGDYYFKGTTHRDNLQFSASPDLTMCHVLKKNNIPIYANTDIILKHYANHKAAKIGSVNGRTEFIPYNG